MFASIKVKAIFVEQLSIMAHIKNQNIFHLVSQDGKKTNCGLSNQYNDAISIERFNNYLKDKSFSKFCCKKCQQKAN